MTSRRSRLKAVANLAVRRKPPLSQSGTKEETSNDNIHTEEVLAPSANKNVVFEKPQNDDSETVITDDTSVESNTTDYILPVGPTANPCSLATSNHVYAAEEFEVQFYTEIQSENVYNNNSNNIDCDIDSESIIVPNIIEPVLKNLDNCNTEKEINNENVSNSSEPTYTELKNVSSNVFGKSPLKTTVYNKNYSFGSDKFYKSSVTRVKDVNSPSNSTNLSTQNTFPDLQNVSQFRRKRSKYNDFTKKLADAKKEFQRKYEKSKPDRSTLKMIDLIFYNPVSNPMESKTKFERKEMDAPQTEMFKNLLAEETVDDPEAMDSESQSCDGNDIQSGNKMPVPQVKIGVNGEIILDEKSLVIETTDAKKGRENLQNTLPVFEDRATKASYYGGKSKKSKDWADFETKRFYKALNTIGPDFTLMQQYFPKRSRLELKNKFKREERLNKNLIDKALNNPSEFDMTQLEKDLDVERKAEEEIELRLCSLSKQSPKKPKTKSSLLSREMVESVPGPKENQSNINSVNFKIMSENEKNKKKKEFDFVFQKLLAKESEKPLSGFPEIPT